MLHFPKPPSPRQLLIVFLSLRTCLFWRFHISGITLSGLCVWLISLSRMFPEFIHVAAASALHSSWWLSDIPLCGWTTLFVCSSAGNTWVVATFLLLGTVLP